jgi:hypothetical protein
MKKRLNFLCGGTKGRVLGQGWHCPCFMPASSRRRPFHVVGHKIRNSVKPTSYGVPFPDAARLLGQRKKHGLKGVVCVGCMPQRAEADPEDHRAVSAHEALKCCLVVEGHESGKQGTVCLFAHVGMSSQVPHMSDDRSELRRSHAFLLKIFC